MRYSSLAGWVFGSVAAMAVALAACSGSVPQSTPRPAVGLAGFPAKHRARPDRKRTWFAPDAKKKTLLYFSDPWTYDVYAYNYRKLTKRHEKKPQGVLTDFNQPQGECVQQGYLWVANTGASRVDEYVPGETRPIRSLTLNGEYPVGCAYDGTTGSFAVSNFSTTSSPPGDGSVWVYPSGSSTPATYAVTNMYTLFFLGYDDQGNLFVDGLADVGGQNVFEFAELPKGAGAFIPISVTGGTLNYPGGVQWDGHHMTLGSQGTPSYRHSALYQLDIQGGNATVISTTALNSALDALQYFIKGNRVVVPDGANGNVQIYKYPAGGSPIKTITGFFVEPTGSAIVTACLGTGCPTPPTPPPTTPSPSPSPTPTATPTPPCKPGVTCPTPTPPPTTPSPSPSPTPCLGHGCPTPTPPPSSPSPQPSSTPTATPTPCKGKC